MSIVETKVDHPEYGHVIFYNLSTRQKQVIKDLEGYKTFANNVVGQNHMLAEELKRVTKKASILEGDLHKLLNK